MAGITHRLGAWARPRRDPGAPSEPIGTLEQIFVTAAGGEPMRPVDSIDAVAGSGLRGDRYATHRGYYSPFDECQVTLIRGEDLDEVARVFGVGVGAGEHRRNLVTRGVNLARLTGRTFSVGEVVLSYDRPRPPCRYIATITEAGMTRALGARRGGICARVVESGVLRVGDPIALR
jgi:MOSC domain-containing protein YiiM